VGLRERFRLFGEKHDPELAYNGVERAGLEGQVHGIRLTPFHGSPGPERGSLIKHRLIQIRGND
jgi:hypothetical protein